LIGILLDKGISMKTFTLKFSLLMGLALFAFCTFQTIYAKSPKQISTNPKEEVALPNTSLAIGLLSDRAQPVTFQFEHKGTHSLHKKHSRNCDHFKGTIKGPKDYKVCKLITKENSLHDKLNIKDSKGKLICSVTFVIRKSPLLQKNIIDIMDSNPDICMRVGPLDNSKHFIILVRNPWEINS